MTPSTPTKASAPDTSRLEVRKTSKLYIGGAFPRSESGRSYEVRDHSGRFVANAALASRKDARDAVVAARKAFSGWAGRTAYNRGQVIYRIAEILEGRRTQFVDDVHSCEGSTRAKAERVVDETIDRLVWYAGWTDKFAQVTGSANPVAGPYFNLSSPEACGVVAAFAPQDSSLLGLVSVLAPIITTGNTAIIVTSAQRPLPAVTLAEALATSDVPGGVINILTGYAAEVGPWLASHLDVNALDLSGITDRELAATLEDQAAGNLKRVLRPRGGEDWMDAPKLDRLTAFTETKTVWHPRGR